MFRYYRNKIISIALIVMVTFCLTSTAFIIFGDKIVKKSGYPLLDEIRGHIEREYFGEYDEDELVYGAAQGMTASLDKYTYYYSPKMFDAYMEHTRGTYVGVGLLLGGTDDNEIVVIEPYEDTPGYRAGIKAGDIIEKINSVAYGADEMDEAANVMRGADENNPEGTSVKLSIRRGEERFEAEVMREELHLKSVEGKMIENNIGYIRLLSFDEDSDIEMKEKIETLTESGMQKLIVDLRDNGGGDFNVCVRMAGLFLDKGAEVVYTEDKNGKRKDFYASGKMFDGDLCIIINEGSASASEVFTGAMRDNSRLKALVGTKSYGKGVTQNVYTLRNGGGLVITVDKYYTPSGECIHEKGIEPYTEVELVEESKEKVSTALSYEEDLQLQKAVELIK